MPAPDEDLRTDEGWNRFLQRHKGQVAPRELAKGQTMLANGKVYDDKTQQEIPPDEVKWTYRLGDGSTIDIDQQGSVSAIDEKPPSVATGTKAPATSDWTGQRMQFDPQTGEYVLFGFDPNDDNPATKWKRVPGATAQPPPSTGATTTEAWQPGSAFGLSDEVEVGGRYVNGVFTPNRVNGQLSTRPRKVEAGTATTAAEWLPDPNNPGREISGRYVNGVFTPNTLNGQPVTRPMKGDKQAAQDFTLGGTRYAWDGDPTHKPVAIATEPAKPEKPEIISPSQVSYQPIPGTNMQQPGRIVNGKFEPIEGMAPVPVASKLIGGPEDKTWTVVDDQGNPIRSYPNPGYQAKPPTLVGTPSTETPYVTTRDVETGVIATQLYPGYQPKTQVDVAAQVGRLQSAAQQKRDELKSRIGQAGYTAEAAARDFDQWWNQTIEPQKRGLSAAQEQAQYERQLKEQEQQRLAQAEQRAGYSTAVQAGEAAARTYQAGARNRVGPQFGNVINQLVQGYATGKAPQNLDVAGAVQYTGPTADDIARQATAEALKFISPTAAGIAGSGQPGVMSALNIGQELDPSQYRNAFGVYTPAVAAGAQPVATPYRQPQQIDLTSPYLMRGPLYG